MRAGRWLIVLLVGVVTVATAASTAFAWGREGHRVIARIAADRLRPDARKAVATLLKSGAARASLADVASWADEIRDARPETANWHFVDIGVDAPGYRARDCHPQDEATHGVCIIAALADETARLRDASLPSAERAQALKFVVHLVGDIHQPLHCAERRGDRGGNLVRITFFGRAYEPSPPSGERTHWNLHAAWDYGLIEHRMQGETAYVRGLEAWIDTQDPHALESGRPVDWANASHALAATHAYRNADATPLPRKGARLGKAYYAANIDVVDRQLAKAGVRLAQVLNDAFP